MIANAASRLCRSGKRPSTRTLLVNLQRGAQSGSSSSNDDINPEFVNRNPRNMEMLRLARKPQGYDLDTPSNHYWYRLLFEPSKKYITARVEHHTGVTVVSATTKEWAIKQHLHSTSDVSAAENIGRVLAERCLQSGICELHTELHELTETSEKLRLFIKALQEGGIQTRESGYIGAHDMYKWNRYLPTLPWSITEEEVLEEDKNAKDTK